MSTVVFSVKGGEQFVDAEAMPYTSGFPELTKVRRDWSNVAYKDYTNTRGPGYPEELVWIEFEPVPGQGALIFEYHFDETFLDQLVISYAHFGWPVIAVLDRKLRDNRTPVTPAARTLFNKSRMLLLEQIAEMLSSIETDLSRFAAQTWAVTINGLTQWRRQFSRYTQTRSRMTDRPLAEKVFDLVKQIDATNRKSEDLESKRRTVNRSGGYEPGKNDNAYPDLFRAYGKEELDLRTAKLDLLRKLFKLFPPALFVVDDLAVTLRRRDTTSYKGTPLTLTYNQADIENKIAEKIDENIQGLRSRIGELDLTPQCQTLLQDGASSIDGLERFVAHRCVDTLDKAVLVAGNVVVAVATVFATPFKFTQWDAFTGLSGNPVLGYPGMVNQYWAQIASGEPRTWRRVVLQSYQNALSQEMRAQQILSARLAFAIRVIKWIEAGISILAFMVLIVATDGALLAVGVPLVCQLIGTAASILSISLLAVTVIELKMVDNVNKAAWRDALLLLSLEDIETVNAVGSALGRMDMYRREVGVEVVKMLIKLALVKLNKGLVEKFQLTTELQVAQHALDLEVLAGDLETIAQETGLVIQEAVAQ